MTSKTVGDWMDKHKTPKCPHCEFPLRTLNAHHYCNNCDTDIFLGESQKKLNMEDKNMTSFKEEAQNYEPPETLNISELESIPVDIEIVEKEFTKEDKSTFTIKVIVVNDKEYRVPVSVLKNLKATLEVKPELKNFKVQKTGEGMKTGYTVVALD